MDWQNLDKKMNSLRRCMDMGDYAKARPLYEQLQAEYDSQTDCSAEYKAIGRELAEIYAAIVVETNSQQEISAAIAQLQKFIGGAYHGFLVARLYWQTKRYLQALGALEELCQLSWQEGKPVIPPENAFWQAIPGEKRLFLTCWDRATSILAWLSRRLSVTAWLVKWQYIFLFRQRITVITFLLFIIFLCHNGSMLRLTRSIIFFILC